MNEKAFLEGSLATHGEPLKVPRHLNNEPQVLNAAKFTCRLALIRLADGEMSSEHFRTVFQCLEGLNKMLKQAPARQKAKEADAEDKQFFRVVEGRMAGAAEDQ